MSRKTVLLGAFLVASLALAAALAAQGEGAKKKAAQANKGASRMLHPELTPEKGSYDQPAGTLGQKPSEPWTATTIGAAVDKKPLEGKIVTVTGEVIDYSCYLQLGKHGAKHKDCGTKCLRNGQPVGLLTKDGSIYLLMEEEHDPRRDGQTSLRDAAIENFAQVVSVTGTRTTVDGQKALYVQGFVKQQ